MIFTCLICKAKSFTIPKNPKRFEVALVQNKMAWHIQDYHQSLPSYSLDNIPPHPPEEPM